MQLAESQRQHLFDLLIACDRPRPDSDALVKKGLAERGRGHFGEWVRITQKGIDTAKGWPEGERIAREARWVNARASKDSVRTTDRGGRATSSVVLRADAAPTEQQFMPTAAALPPGEPEVAPSQLLSQQPAPNTTSPKRMKEGNKQPRSRGEVVPNAVRVIRANKVSYYPISMFTSIQDDSKQRCRTANRFYRTYALAASEPDQVVL